MSLPTGVDAGYSQREDEAIPYIFDFGPACRDANGALIDSVSSATIASTAGVTVGTAAYGTTTVQVLVSAGTAGNSYTIRCLATMANSPHQLRDLAIQVTFTAKATAP